MADDTPANATACDSIAATNTLNFDESQNFDSETLLEEKKKRLLQQLEAEILPMVNKTNSTESTTTGHDCTAGGINEVEVIDKPAFVESPVGDNDHDDGNYCVVDTAEEAATPSNAMEMPENGSGVNNTETDLKKASRSSRRRGKGGKKFSQGLNSYVNGNGYGNVMAESKGFGDGCKRVYSRKEMQALRYVNVAQQRRFWKEIYNELEPVVAKEYDALSTRKLRKNIARDSVETNVVASIVTGVDNGTETIEKDGVGNVSSVDPVCGNSISGGDESQFLEEASSDDGDSDEEYDTILRPAFLVEGEPDLNSGPPEDGLEYLRRVRWEAAQIPKVKVAKIDRSKFNKEQSIYMPKIPDIVKCPEHLMPLKPWEDVFLADFKELRESLSCLSESSIGISGKQPILIVNEKDWPSQSLETVVNVDVDSGQVADTAHQDFVGFVSETSVSNPSLPTAEGGRTPVLPNVSTKPKGSVKEVSVEDPTLSATLNMDTVTRSTILRKRIKLAETSSVLSRKDCLWIYALCAAIDTPLDADTAAALRSLLRKCASLRAEKSDLDDEVIMLNILATIAGRYFGQSET